MTDPYVDTTHSNTADAADTANRTPLLPADTTHPYVNTTHTYVQMTHSYVDIPSYTFIRLVSIYQ